MKLLTMEVCSLVTWEGRKYDRIRWSMVKHMREQGVGPWEFAQPLRIEACFGLAEPPAQAVREAFRSRTGDYETPDATEPERQP